MHDYKFHGSVDRGSRRLAHLVALLLLGFAVPLVARANGADANPRETEVEQMATQEIREVPDLDSTHRRRQMISRARDLDEEAESNLGWGVFGLLGAAVGGGVGGWGLSTGDDFVGAVSLGSAGLCLVLGIVHFARAGSNATEAERYRREATAIGFASGGSDRLLVLEERVPPPRGLVLTLGSFAF